MAGKLKITFTEAAIYKSSVTVEIDTGAGNINLSERVELVRSGAGQMKQGGTALETASNYAAAFNLDYSNTGGNNNLSAMVIDGVVEINLQNPSWQFVSASGSAPFTDEINNEPIQPAKSGDIVGFSAGNNPCSDLIASFEATGGNGTYRVYLDGNLAAESASPISVPMKRDIYYNVSITDTLGESIWTRALKPPRKLIPNDLVIDIKNYESGASLNIDVRVISQWMLPYEYSLDGVEWRTTNVFSGIASGNYTLYVKDKFGCEVTKDFIVDGTTSLTETVFTISDINALHFAKAEGGKKNLENTLSCNENKPLTYPFYHKYLESDIITTQFKTNAQYIDAYTIDTKGNKRGLAPVKLTENIGLEAKSTATYFSLGGGRSAIYFGVIDILDVVTDSVIETVDLGFTLPEWANAKGQLVSIEHIGQVPIDAIGYSDFYDSFVLEFNVAYAGEPTTKTLYAQYNLQPYEVYEFNVYMANEAELFNVVIEAGATNTEIAYVSEKVKRVNDSDRLMEITYTDNQNKGDMVYQTGIVHKMRLEGLSDYIGEQETEGYNGDNGYNVTDNSIFKTERFLFPRLSSAMAHKLRLVMSHTILNINGIMYKIAESPEINTDINNNFKTFLVVLKSGGDLFLDSSQEIIGGSESESLSGALEASKGKSLLLWTKQNN